MQTALCLSALALAGESQSAIVSEARATEQPAL